MTPRLEGMGTEAFAMALAAIEEADQVPLRRSSNPLRRKANSTRSVGM
jgi:hypothetical protein